MGKVRDTNNMKPTANRAELPASGVKTLLWTMLMLTYIVISLNCKPVEAAGTTTQDAYEPDDTYSQANAIAIDGKAQSHNFHKAGDADYVRFYALKGDTYEIKVANQGQNCRPVIYLYGSYGTNVVTYKESRKAGEELILSWKFTEEGVYYASISSAETGVFGSGTDYDLSVYRPTAPSLPVAINGTITNCTTNTAIDNAKVKVADKWTAVSNDNGYYEMIVSDGTNTMDVSAYGYYPVTKTVKVEKGKSTVFDTCLSSYGYPIPSLKVKQSETNARELKVTVALDAGYYANINADWWLFYMGGNNYGSFALDQGLGWINWITYAHQGPLFTLPQTELTVTVPSDGNYTFWFVVDTNMNGLWDAYDPLKMFWKAYTVKVSQ
ncbi:MAG: carboxypeptidase regulatory-like domain-containing protein [Candidatus Magnetobacterium sp. LHC-1]